MSKNIIPPPAPPLFRISVTVDMRGTMNIESQDFRQPGVQVPLIQAASILATANKSIIDMMIQQANGNRKAATNGDNEEKTIITGE